MKGKMIKWGKLSGLALALILVLAGCSLNLASAKKNLKPDEAKAKAEKYINDNLMQGSKATVDSVTEENGLYKLKVNIGNGQTVDSYITKDGKTFFPQSMAIEESTTPPAPDSTGDTAQKNNEPAPTNAPKTDKPVVELFVMSHCPYGLQIEKGIIPVVEKLGNKIDFKLKFCDYAMHGENELKEELNQTCIAKNDPGKLMAYLKCFTKSGDGAACIKEVKIDSGKLSSCVSATDKQFQVMKKFADKTDYKGSYPPFDVFAADNQKYNVGGSPTLVVNGTEIQSGRSASDLMAAICSAFNKTPGACSEKLDSASPSAGFGAGTASDSGAAAGCGQ
ncbi:MAG: hypothetical protein WCW77_05395 [Patescibacteria group bacterium]|jgi:hypothetical protein